MQPLVAVLGGVRSQQLKTRAHPTMLDSFHTSLAYLVFGNRLIEVEERRRAGGEPKQFLNLFQHFIFNTATPPKEKKTLNCISRYDS